MTNSEQIDTYCIKIDIENEQLKRQHAQFLNIGMYRKMHDNKC